ncbi:MAG: AbrB/MazE/SpoVT family DNA-binding domain-containing protein [Chloroflexi bacterium]|nr:AbrB/MazE/SpoVT family DNA-binding domain-containing protein [Chloroflexota bacterium]MDA8188435.1 AbrB/MazE/SpoVT family DNA-binding domain-containing protein [Dehalococcoidales bacterium]
MVVKMTERGTVTLPKEVRPKQEGEVFFSVVRREDGVIELHPQVAVDASKAWFWSDRWQAMEREVQESYDRGRFQRHQSGEGLLAHLKKLAGDSETERQD